MILKQAAISAALGFGMGTIAVYAIVALTAFGNVAVIMPVWLLAVLALLTLLMCAFGALISIRRLVRIDPASVFS